ncbi:DUF3102 domain-containing protein [Hoeflea sp.]|nr:DUF3102 domain-containing protein [Hoeflea sp.]MBV1786129.1 DUF3102 domain-containing protein [Hoeflea sp.]
MLAEVANTHHDAAVAALRIAADTARVAGNALLEAKTLVPHGKWAGWIKANFRGGMRTAQRYMKVAKNWETIAGKNDSVSLLTVTQALELLDGGDELERALKNQAEAEAIHSELKFMDQALATADADGLNHIIARVEEINRRLVDLRDVAIRESCRLRKELDALKETA